MNQKLKSGFRKAVFLVTYRIKKDKQNKSKPEYIILKRKKHWVGWEFPKGGVEEGENLFAAAKRECYEETGLKPNKIKKFNIKGKYYYKRKFRDRPGYIGQTYSLFACKVSWARVRYDSREHSYFMWLSFNKAIKKLTHKNQKKCLEIVNNFLIAKRNPQHLCCGSITAYFFLGIQKPKTNRTF